MTKRDKSSKSTAKGDFDPSMKSLIRIMKFMSENKCEGKTSLSLGTNMNYNRLSKHIDWLEKRRLVESIVKDGRINIVLTREGRKFASAILTC